VVIGASTALLALGTALMLSADSPTTRPNVQTAGLVLAVIGLTALTVVLSIRDPAD
jgi:hypothetical protein